jgi:hypothetical protein
VTLIEEWPSSAETRSTEVLRDHWCVGVPVLFGQFGDGCFPGFNLVGALAAGGFRRWRIQVFDNGA